LTPLQNKNKTWQDLTKLKTPESSNLDQMFGINLLFFLTLLSHVLAQDSDDEMPALESPGTAGVTGASTAVVEEEVLFLFKKYRLFSK
jgi:hypothetical protein